MNSDSKDKLQARLAAFLVPALIAAVSCFFYFGSLQRLPSIVLGAGLLVWSPGEYIYHGSDPRVNGASKNAVDRNPETAAIQPYPAPHPEGSHWIIDCGLSHWPPAAPGQKPRPRRPDHILIYNGPCTSCSPRKFRAYGRIRRARLEILYRKANNPDKDFKHEPSLRVLTLRKEFPDAPGPVKIPLPLPAAGPSPGFPVGMIYIRAKITVESAYPGEKFPDRVALAEFRYADRGSNEALQKKGAPL